MDDGPVGKGRAIRKEIWVEKRGKKYYADIVKGDNQQKRKGPAIATHKQILPWMENSVIGQFNEDLDFEQLEEEFLKGGMSMIKVRYLGDNLAMLTPREGDSMENLIYLNKDWFESVFDNINPWSENHVAGHKIVWVRCYGIPISLWNKDCFSKVVGEMASLVSIDKSTLLWENLEYARLQVRLLKNHNARLAKSMWINDHFFSILVEEEIPCENRGPCKCSYECFASFDSISSSETYVEETACSINSCEEEVGRRDREVRWSKEEVNGGEVMAFHVFFLNQSSKMDAEAMGE